MTIWTADAVSVLTKRWLLGTPAKVIAEELGPQFNKNKVVGKAHRLHLPAHDNAKNCGWVVGVRNPRKRRIYKSRIRAQRRPDVTPPDPMVVLKPSLPSVLQAEPLPVMPAEPSGGHPVTLMDLQAHHCRWPLGSPAGPKTLFCGGTAQTGPYCLTHGRMAFNAGAVRASA